MTPSVSNEYLPFLRSVRGVAVINLNEVFLEDISRKVQVDGCNSISFIKLDSFKGYKR
jgi:hypothetical protein